MAGKGCSGLQEGKEGDSETGVAGEKKGGEVDFRAVLPEARAPERDVSPVKP